LKVGRIRVMMRDMNKKLSDIGLIGLAVMGENLVLNMADHGFQVSVFNRTVTKVDHFLANGAKGKSIVGTHTLADFVSSLQRPRRIVMMVKAGEAVDQLVDQLLPLLDKGDILIDGGNSLFTDTERRVAFTAKEGIAFLGVGISGGEEGARNGPSIMPGGNKEGWEPVRPIFQAIAAKVGSEPCCEWVGEGGAGHFVKMVHNGIEYGDMQLISEAFDILREGYGLSIDELQKIFSDWNQGDLDSYLIEITAQILKAKENGTPKIDKILDAAAQKGTGKWTVMQALELGIPLTLISESVFARFLSSMKDERVLAAGHYPKKSLQKEEAPVEAVRQALYGAKMISYAQGFMMMRAASEAYKWGLNFGGVALMWRGGCIIRSRFLGKIKEAYEKDPALLNLLMDPFFKGEIVKVEEGLRKTVASGALRRIPLPCHSSGLSFLDGYRRERLPAYLLQAQRDFFGAHSYERTDQPRGKHFHTEWMAPGTPEAAV